MISVSPWYLLDMTNPHRHARLTHMAQVNQGRGIKHKTFGGKPKSCVNDQHLSGFLIFSPYVKPHFWVSFQKKKKKSRKGLDI